jgi:delta24(24(1))-sterol reductase
MNGHANGHAESNGHAPESVVNKEAGNVTEDHKYAYDQHIEFGGQLGVSAIMIGFPILMWYMWIGATYYEGGIPSRAPGETFSDFGKRMVGLVVEGAYPHTKAWMIYWVFLIVQGAFYLLLPGIYVYGKPLEHLDGKRLQYYCSAFSSFYTSIAMAAVLHITGIFPLYTILDEFGPLLTVAIISGWVVSFIAYFSAIARGAQHRMSGLPIYDFFMGAELNPRLFGLLDFKMFCEVRLPWYLLFFLSAAAATRQYERYGYVSGEVAFIVMAHWLYANACCKAEELITTTWYVLFSPVCCSDLIRSWG